MSGERPGGWVEGIGWVAMVPSLADGDEFEFIKDDGGWKWLAATHWTIAAPVIVTRWADGTTPTPPNPDTDGGWREGRCSSCGTPLYQMGRGGCDDCKRLTEELAATPALLTPLTETPEQFLRRSLKEVADNERTAANAARVSGSIGTPPETVPVPRDIAFALGLLVGFTDSESHFMAGLTADHVRTLTGLLHAAAGVSGE